MIKLTKKWILTSFSSLVLTNLGCAQGIELDLEKGRYVFIGLDTGTMGRMDSSAGLMCLSFIEFPQDKVKDLGVFHIYLDPQANKKKQKFTFKADLYKKSIENKDAKKIIVYKTSWTWDSSSRLKVFKEVNPRVAKTANAVPIQGIIEQTIPFLNVEGEIYRIVVVQSNQLDDLKQLPITALQFMYKWRPTQPALWNMGGEMEK